MIKMNARGLLDNIEIAAPCAVSWESMSGDEKKRFCQHCQMNVYNISEMSSVEAQQLLLKGESSESLCVRLYRRLDGTVMTKNCPVGLKKLRAHWSRFAHAIGVTVLWIFSSASSVKAGDTAPLPRRAQKRLIDFGVKPNVRPVPEQIQESRSQTMGRVDGELAFYMKDINSRILAGWLTTSGFDLSKYRVVIAFKILKDGSASSVRVLKSCGVAQYDAIAIESVRKAGPFRALPSFASDPTDVEFTFDNRLSQDFQENN